MTRAGMAAAEILTARGARVPLGQGQMEQSEELKMHPMCAGPGGWVRTFPGPVAQTERYAPRLPEPQREGYSQESRPGPSLPYPGVCPEAALSVRQYRHACP